VILIFLVGSPPHQDMFDLKANGPKGISGPWKPAAATAPGIQINEAFSPLVICLD
jgi:hypothetical protein